MLSKPRKPDALNLLPLQKSNVRENVFVNDRIREVKMECSFMQKAGA